MNRSTILHPALLGHANRFGREARRIGQAAAQPGLFDLVDRVGQGPAHGAADALRTLQVLGEAYGLGPQALREWMHLLAHNTLPPPDGPLRGGCAGVLPDLLMRAHTLALYHQAQGHGDALMIALRAAKPLRGVVGASRPGQLEQEIQRYAPHLLRVLPSVRHASGAGEHLGGLRDLRARLGHLGLTGPGWRWLLKNLPYKVFDGGDAESAPPGPEYWVCQANWFGAVGPEFVPHPALVDLLFDQMQEMFLYKLPLQDHPWLLRAAHQQCMRVQEDPEELRYLLQTCVNRMLLWVLVLDWRPDINQRRSGWPALERALERAACMDRHKNLSWPAAVASLVQGGLTARALKTSAALLEEGRAMRSCVGDLEVQCACGTLLVYSVTQADGTRVATLSIERVPDTGSWKAHDIKARFNRPVADKALIRLLHKLVTMVNAHSTPAATP